MRCGVSRSVMMRAGEPMAIELAGTSTFYRCVWRNQHIVPDGHATDDARVGADIDIVADFGCALVFAKRRTDKNTLRRIVPRASRVLRC